MKARYIIIPLIFILIAVGVRKLMSNKEKFEIVADEKDEIQLRYVKVMEAELKTNAILIEGQGKISTSQKVDISTEVQGLLQTNDKIIKPGVSFRRGEILYTVRNNDARLQLQARKSSFLTLIAGALPDIKLDFSSNYESWKNFYESIEIDKVLPDLPSVKSQKEKTFISLKNIFTEYYNIKADEERLWKYVITAPFDGSITDVFVEPGSVVNPGTRIASIIRTGDLEIDIPVDVTSVPQIKIGSKVELTSTTGNKNFEGTVVRMGDFVNATTQSVPVYIKINKKQNDVLLNGMYLIAKIHCGEIENSIKIDRRALPDREHYYSLVKKTDAVKFFFFGWIPYEKKVNAFALKKNKLNTQFVLRNHVIATDIPNGEMILNEPITIFTKSTLFMPINETK